MMRSLCLSLAFLMLFAAPVFAKPDTPASQIGEEMRNPGSQDMDESLNDQPASENPGSAIAEINRMEAQARVEQAREMRRNIVAERKAEAEARRQEARAKGEDARWDVNQLPEQATDTAFMSIDETSTGSEETETPTGFRGRGPVRALEVLTEKLENVPGAALKGIQNAIDNIINWFGFSQDVVDDTADH